MGLEILKGPALTADAGMFNLPPGFDTKRWAVEWVEEGQVPFKRQRQSLAGAGMSADGWTVYKGEDEMEEDGVTVRRAANSKPTITTNGAGKKFLLMVRPKQLQNDVNAVYGNVSKKSIQREIKGETVAGAPSQDQDPGMLPEARLREAQTEGSLDNDEIKLNKLSSEVAEPSAAVST